MVHNESKESNVQLLEKGNEKMRSRISDILKFSRCTSREEGVNLECYFMGVMICVLVDIICLESI